MTTYTYNDTCKAYLRKTEDTHIETYIQGHTYTDGYTRTNTHTKFMRVSRLDMATFQGTHRLSDPGNYRAHIL